MRWKSKVNICDVKEKIKLENSLNVSYGRTHKCLAETFQCDASVERSRDLAKYWEKEGADTKDSIKCDTKLSSITWFYDRQVCLSSREI